MDDRQLRASDAERNAVIDQLRTHTAEGRLALAEFEERVSEALHATTRAELEDVLRELPALDPTPAGRDEAVQQDRKPRVALSRVSAVALGVVGVVALVVVVPGHFFWWLIPIFFWTGGFGLFGGCADGQRTRGFCGSTTTSVDGRGGRSFGSSHGPSMERQLTEV